MWMITLDKSDKNLMKENAKFLKMSDKWTGLEKELENLHKMAKKAKADKERLLDEYSKMDRDIGATSSRSHLKKVDDEVSQSEREESQHDDHEEEGEDHETEGHEAQEESDNEEERKSESHRPDSKSSRASKASKNHTLKNSSKPSQKSINSIIKDADNLDSKIKQLQDQKDAENTQKTSKDAPSSRQSSKPSGTPVKADQLKIMTDIKNSLDGSMETPQAHQTRRVEE